MMERIPRSVVHFGKHDPRVAIGGVATFARNLELIFERVDYFTPEDHDFAKAGAERTVIIADNHWVSRLPAGMPAIGFQHGVAFEKWKQTRSLGDLALAVRQRNAARREPTLWVACARWIGKAFGELHGNAADFVVYHHTDLERFDGRLDNTGSRLVLHDARNPHKGSRQIAWLRSALPEWQFEALACPPEAVPARLRKAAAFLHLSRYEGNSIVCNEAMAQNLPCLFTNVGLFRDEDAPTEVVVLDASRAFDDRRWLVERVSSFLEGLATRRFEPRDWVERHASPDATKARWLEVLERYDRLPWPERSGSPT